VASSGTYNFAMANTSVVLEAFDRIQKPPPVLTRHMLVSARNSLNLELAAWSNAGMNFWETTGGTINLAVGTGTYTLPTNLVTMTELWYSTVNGGGTGVNNDRIMVPITRTQYSMIVNKNQQGIPTQYWFQMLETPQVTIWEVPFVGAPNYVLEWYGMQRVQDANLAGGETPDIPYRAIDALCARMALRLCEKFGPVNPQARQAMMMEKKAAADEAWELLMRRDQEPGPMTINANIAAYGKM